MRWGAAAGIVVAAAAWGARGGIDQGRDADAKATASPNADAIPNAAAVPKPDSIPNADAKPSQEAHRAEVVAVGRGDVRPALDEEAHAVAVAGDLEIYVVRAAREGRRAPAVFLTGSCTHPLTYLNAFRHAAAEHGGVVALQGDLPCKADPSLRRWSPDTVATSARIDAALLAAGATGTDDLTLMGYSQGSERAEWLARRFPAKYTRFVLMAGPVVPSPARLSGARAVATLAGYGDVRENMADGARRLRRASIPATYIELPGTHHGELAPSADVFVGRALDWIDANAIATETAQAHASAGPPPAEDAGTRAPDISRGSWATAFSRSPTYEGPRTLRRRDLGGTMGSDSHVRAAR